MPVTRRVTKKIPTLMFPYKALGDMAGFDRVDYVEYNWSLLSPRVAPFAAVFSQYICLGDFLRFHIGSADDIACKLFIGGGDLKMPCLGIGESERGFRWISESRDITGYLQGWFVAAVPNQHTAAELYLEAHFTNFTVHAAPFRRSFSHPAGLSRPFTKYKSAISLALRYLWVAK